jgi:hypothetical protein
LKTKFWLSLPKHSPKSYTLFWVLFCLSSGWTLQSLLSTVHFRTGINTHVLDSLFHSLQKVSEKYRYCYLLFDETSIRENSYCYVYVFLLLSMLCSVYSVFIVSTGILRLPWLRFFCAFSSVVRQMPEYNSQRRGTVRTLPN